MIKNVHLMQYFLLDHADLIANAFFVSLYDDFE